MEDHRIKLTVDESRRLFHSTMASMRQSCKENLIGTMSMFMSTTDAIQRFEEIWPQVEEELRKAYELCRFSISVEGLDEDTDDVEVFRGYCEDYDGVEPLDYTLFEKVANEIAGITEALDARSAYRARLPPQMDAMFLDHVKDQRRQFDALLNVAPAPPAKSTELENIDLFPPQDLGRVMDELLDRLTSLKEQAELVSGP